MSLSSPPKTENAINILPVVRYDTAHRVVHKDLLDLKGREKKVLLGMSDLREAPLLADEDIKTNWRRYKDRFLWRRQR